MGKDIEKHSFLCSFLTFWYCSWARVINTNPIFFLLLYSRAIYKASELLVSWKSEPNSLQNSSCDVGEDKFWISFPVCFLVIVYLIFFFLSTFWSLCFLRYWGFRFIDTALSITFSGLLRVVHSFIMKKFHIRFLYFLFNYNFVYSRVLFKNRLYLPMSSIFLKTSSSVCLC